jgi:hypothetical protein
MEDVSSLAALLGMNMHFSECAQLLEYVRNELGEDTRFVLPERCTFNFRVRFAEPVKNGQVAAVSVSIPLDNDTCILEMCNISPSGACDSNIYYPGSREGVVEKLRQLADGRDDIDEDDKTTKFEDARRQLRESVSFLSELDLYLAEGDPAAFAEGVEAHIASMVDLVRSM